MTAMFGESHAHSSSWSVRITGIRSWTLLTSGFGAESHVTIEQLAIGSPILVFVDHTAAKREHPAAVDGEAVGLRFLFFVLGVLPLVEAVGEHERPVLPVRLDIRVAALLPQPLDPGVNHWLRRVHFRRPRRQETPAQHPRLRLPGRCDQRRDGIGRPDVPRVGAHALADLQTEALADLFREFFRPQRVRESAAHADPTLLQFSDTEPNAGRRDRGETSSHAAGCVCAGRWMKRTGRPHGQGGGWSSCCRLDLTAVRTYVR